MLTDEVIAKLKEQHPGVDLFKLSTKPPGADEPIEGVAKPPRAQAWRMVRELAQDKDPAKKVESTRALFDECLVYPSGTAKSELVARWPGIVDLWSGEMSEFAGLVAGTVVSKL